MPSPELGVGHAAARVFAAPNWKATSRSIRGFMADKAVQRRLAAILAADVVGYSRLMNIDEVRTLDALKAHRRELIDPTIASHRGRIVKTTGDGVLVEF